MDDLQNANEGAQLAEEEETVLAWSRVEDAPLRRHVKGSASEFCSGLTLSRP